MLKKHKNIVIAISAIILIFFGYWYFVLSKKDKTASSNSLVASNSAQGTPPSAVTSYDREFVSNLQTVRYIDLNTNIFSQPSYKALTFPEIPFEVDYNIPAGRRNPFLPLGVEAGTNIPVPAQQPTSSAASTTPVTPVATTTTQPRTTR